MLNFSIQSLTMCCSWRKALNVALRVEGEPCNVRATPTSARSVLNILAQQRYNCATSLRDL